MLPSLQRFAFNQQTLQYRDLETGTVLSLQDEIEVIERRIDDGVETLEDFAAAMLDGENGDITDFQIAFTNELRNMHAQATIVGSGGRDNMETAQWVIVVAVLLSELNFANNLTNDIVTGGVSRRELSRRMRMFANKVRNAYWNGRTSIATRVGFTEERRVLQPAEHCEDCVALAVDGWQPIGSLPNPGDGSTQCLSNDKCIKEFRR